MARDLLAIIGLGILFGIILSLTACSPFPIYYGAGTV